MSKFCSYIDCTEKIFIFVLRDDGETNSLVPGTFFVFVLVQKDPCFFFFFFFFFCHN